MLDGNHAPNRETAAVAGTVHFVDNRGLHVAATQEIGVQRMCDALVDRGCALTAPGQAPGHQNLRAANVATVATIDIVFNPLKLSN